jgi:hypothetical protein
MVDLFFTHLLDDPLWLPLLENAGVSEEKLNAIEIEVSLPE